MTRRGLCTNAAAAVDSAQTAAAATPDTAGAHTALADSLPARPSVTYEIIVGSFATMRQANKFAAEIDFALIPNYAHLFGGITGDVNKTSFKALTRENPWLAALGATNSIRNSVDRMHVFGGIKGNAGATFGYGNVWGKTHRRWKRGRFFCLTKRLLICLCSLRCMARRCTRL